MSGELEYGQLFCMKWAFLICKALEDTLAQMVLYQGRFVATKKAFCKSLRCERATSNAVELFGGDSSRWRKRERLHSCHNKIGSLSFLSGSHEFPAREVPATCEELRRGSSLVPLTLAARLPVSP